MKERRTVLRRLIALAGSMTGSSRVCVAQAEYGRLPGRQVLGLLQPRVARGPEHGHPGPPAAGPRRGKRLQVRAWPRGGSSAAPPGVSLPPEGLERFLK